MKEVNYISVHSNESLQNIAGEIGGDNNSTVLLYIQGRLLYRLSISNYREKFLLKGDHFLYALRKSNQKVTKKIEFLATYLSNDRQSIKEAFGKICSGAYEADGVEFDANGIIAEQCNQGIYIEIPATYKGEKEIVQLIISFGDFVVPKPQKLHYPVLSDRQDVQAPVIWAYSTETIVAEKVEEILSSSILTDNLEPFYDMHVLLETQDFDGRVLLEAVFETFQRRGTIIEKEQPLFTQAFIEDEERVDEWRNSRSDSGHEENLEFPQVMQHIGNFLAPIYQAILEEKEYFKTWNSKTQTWI
ncbi:nucleotidyl transferase AbiEii/AbiGii toxin family protein [Oceanobacillus rekensis]|uniref:nucleotidyl transferase AbiEii/AbiGii toxin family protein n=1 Tax=Oceanobacillus rekensis TaxID=937927 RepID=UPI000B4354E7|nr:nucleotidyl transferase AbiEii/AbiGii toxin family protein [Oceanobacillus rekensis]